MKKSTKKGRIIIPAGRKPWPHELRVAEILAANGHKVEFILESSLKTPDIYLDSTRYEIKSPITNNPKKIIRNIKRALEKCPNVIIDTSRIKSLDDASIQRCIKNKTKDLHGIKGLLIITRRHQIIDILGHVWYN